VLHLGSDTGLGGGGTILGAGHQGQSSGGDLGGSSGGGGGCQFGRERADDSGARQPKITFPPTMVRLIPCRGSTCVDGIPAPCRLIPCRGSTCVDMLLRVCEHVVWTALMADLKDLLSVPVLIFYAPGPT
jgi:hypothetical protein